MPRRVLGREPISKEHQDALIAALVEEIRHPRDAGQPVILEDQSSPSGAVQVHVIWDRWEECPEEHRSDLVLQAYEEAEGPEFRQRITFALGVTKDEAIPMGLLPWVLVVNRRKLNDSENGPAFDQHLQAMLDLGTGVTPRGSHGPELRFATQDDAEAARERLEEKLPGSSWIVFQERPADY